MEEQVDAWTSMCLCVSGSVAAVKAPEIITELMKRGVHVDLVVTKSAERLLHASYKGVTPWAKLVGMAENYKTDATEPVAKARVTSYHPCLGSSQPCLPSSNDAGDVHFRNDEACALSSKVEVKSLPLRGEAGDRKRGQPKLWLWRDEDEWSCYHVVGEDQVLHVELAKRNNLLLVAPLCANSLAAMANGSCGNLFSSVVRAWYYDLDPTFSEPLARRFGEHTVRRPVVVAPAMNTIMWHQRVTSEHLQTLQVDQVLPLYRFLASVSNAGCARKFSSRPPP